MKSLGAMIKQLGGMVGGNDLSDWEDDFVKSVVEKSDDGTNTVTLTEKQIEKIEGIYSKHFGDAA